MHETDIPGFTLHASNEQQPPHALPVRSASTFMRWTGQDWSPTTNEFEPITWHPLTGVSGKIGAAITTMKDIGSKIVDKVTSAAEDIGSTLYAAATGEPPTQPGPAFRFASGFASSIQRVLPTAVQRAIGTAAPAEPAGYITLADGTRIPVAKYQDPELVAEKARSAIQSSAGLRPDYDAALERAKLALAQRKQADTEEDARRVLIMRERAAAQAEEMNQLQIRAAELANEKETSSSAQRALWGRPSTIDQEEQSHRKIKQIGVAGGGPTLVQLY